MEVCFRPPPNLTRLEETILQLDTYSKYPDLDDNQINAFFRDRYCFALHSKMLYNILKKEIQPLTGKERRDLREWTKIDKSVSNSAALPDFFDFAREVRKHALVQDNMLRLVKYKSTKYLKQEHNVNLTPKVNRQLIEFFREKFDNNMKAFPFL
jgi:hypothetical protein